MRAIYCMHVDVSSVACVAAMNTAFEGLHVGEVILVRSDGDGNEARRRIAAVMTRIIGDFEILRGIVAQHGVLRNLRLEKLADSDARIP